MLEVAGLNVHRVFAVLVGDATGISHANSDGGSLSAGIVIIERSIAPASDGAASRRLGRSSINTQGKGADHGQNDSGIGKHFFEQISNMI